MLLALLFVEVVTIRVLWSPLPEKRIAHRAFLTKQNDQYILAWRNGVGTVELVQMESLPEILRRANELQLSVAKNIDPGSSVESAWVSDRRGSYVLLWKTENDPLYQMSFYRESDAQFFASAFRQGAYTRSILGHSVLMVGHR